MMIGTDAAAARDRASLRTVKVFVLVGLVGLAALAQGGTTLETGWSVHDRAGVQALRRGHYAEAKRRFRTAIAKAEQFPAPDSRLVESLTGLAKVHSALHEYAKAEPVLARAVVLEEQLVGPRHPTLAAMLADYALLLRNLERADEAAVIEARIRSILSDPVLEAPSTIWVKRGADQEDFHRDRQDCLEEAWYGASAFGPLVDPEIYGECLEQRGWRATTRPRQDRGPS